MQISAQDAISNGFVRDRNNEKIERSYVGKSSIDLTIRQIIFKGDKDNIITLSNAELKPQDSVFVISEETIHVPEGFVAYVFLKNRLSQRGFLALNTGIIDSKYSGPISTLLINFSNVSQCLPVTDSPDDQFFFRVVFHEIVNLPTDFMADESHVNLNASDKYESYHSYRKMDLEKFPRSFMQPSILKEQVGKELTEKLSAISLKNIGFMVAVVGLFLSLIPLGRDYYFSERYDIKDFYDYKAKSQYEIQKLNEKIENLEKNIAQPSKLVPKNKRDADR